MFTKKVHEVIELIDKKIPNASKPINERTFNLLQLYTEKSIYRVKFIGYSLVVKQLRSKKIVLKNVLSSVSDSEEERKEEEEKAKKKMKVYTLEEYKKNALVI
jgi:hypothetical protein